MATLQQRQEKIQAKRKQTSFRDFVMEVASWFPVSIYKQGGLLTKYPPHTSRVKHIISSIDKESASDVCLEYSGSFFQSFAELWLATPHVALDAYGDNENCEYAESVYGAKNSYLSFSIGNNAVNVLYSCFVWMNVTDVFDSFFVEHDCQNIYGSRFVQRSSYIFCSQSIVNSSYIYNSSQLFGCTECINCHGLENVSFYIDNVSYTKEEYFLKKKELSFGEIGRNSFADIEKFSSNSPSTENAVFCRDVVGGRNIFCGAGGYQGSSNLYDTFDGGNDSHDFYAVGMSGTGSSQLYCSYGIGWSHTMLYGIRCESCSFCLGCIGLKNKSYCILNKQYTKEERYEKVDEIFQKMEQTPSNFASSGNKAPLSKGENQLGEFFPASMNPFYFNDTAAYLIDPSFTKEEVTKLGYLRRDEPIKVDIPEGTITVKSSELSGYELRVMGEDGKNERKLDETVCKRVIIDDNGDAYRIIPMELEFLQKHGLPLPRKHRLTRMKEKFRIS